MAWIELTEMEVLSRLANDEVEALKTAATNSEQPDVVSKIISMCVQEWRGLIRRHHAVSGGNTIPAELEGHVLADIRYRLFTRLPGMKALLDDRRVAEWDESNRTKGRLKDYVFETPDTSEATAEMPQAGIEIAKVDARIFTRESMRGL